MTEQSLMEGNNSRYLGSTKNSGASQSHGNMVKGMCGLREVPAGHLDKVGRKESSPACPAHTVFLSSKSHLPFKFVNNDPFIKLILNVKSRY